MVRTNFNLQHVSQNKTVDMYDTLGFDYNRELHWIDHVAGQSNTERRSLIKLHFIVYPKGKFAYNVLCFQRHLDKAHLIVHIPIVCYRMAQLRKVVCFSEQNLQYMGSEKLYSNSSASGITRPGQCLVDIRHHLGQCNVRIARRMAQYCIRHYCLFVG